MKTIGVLGGGTMGAGIVQVSAMSGFNVILRDLSEEAIENAKKGHEKVLSKLVSKEKITEEQKSEIISNIKYTTNVNDLADVDIIIEAATESMEIKKKIFNELESVCKESTIFATNTSSLSITELASSTNRPEKVIGMHFFNPVPLMKLVEIIKGIITDEDTFNKVNELTSKLNKTAVKVEEAPGFVVNRILIPMINEAVGVLADGVANEEDIDKSMTLGANHPIGPLALADLIGLDVCLAIMDVLYDEYKDSKYRAHPLLRKMVRGNKLGRKTKSGFYQY